MICEKCDMPKAERGLYRCFCEFKLSITVDDIFEMFLEAAAKGYDKVTIYPTVMGAIDSNFDVGEEECFPEFRITYGFYKLKNS